MHLKQAGSTLGSSLANSSVSGEAELPVFNEVEPKGGGRPSLSAGVAVGAFGAPVTRSDLPISSALSAPPQDEDWTVRVEKAPLGVGCMPYDTGFGNRHSGNYFMLGHVMRERLGMTESQWNRSSARTPGCLRISAVPKVKMSAEVAVNFSDGSNGTKTVTWETEVEDNALEAFTTPIGKPLLPNGAVLDVSSARPYQAIGQGITRTRVAWSSGDLFGASFARLPPHLSGTFRRPLDAGPIGMRRNASGYLKQAKVMDGDLVTLVRPPPLRVYQDRFVVGAPRAWAGSGRRGALCIVDFTVDLLDRPIALNAEGEPVSVDMTVLSDETQAEGPDLLRRQDLEERLLVAVSNPVVLAAPGVGAELTRQSNAGAVDLDMIQLQHGERADISSLFGPGSLLGASTEHLGKLALPVEARQNF